MRKTLRAMTSSEPKGVPYRAVPLRIVLCPHILCSSVLSRVRVMDNDNAEEIKTRLLKRLSDDLANIHGRAVKAFDPSIQEINTDDSRTDSIMFIQPTIDLNEHGTSTHV